MEKIKTAIIGLGRIGAETSTQTAENLPNGWLPINHIESIKAIPKLELIALCDVSEEKLKKYGEQYDVKNLYTSYEKMISEVKPDFLTIATRAEIRPEIIKYASINGVKGIYFEKPICRSVIETRQILLAAHLNNVILSYGVNRRYHSAYREAKQLLKSGIIGDLKEIIIEHGIGNLYWSHPHTVDLALFFSEQSKIDFVQGKCSFVNNYTIDDQFLIDNDPILDYSFIQFENGVKATINQSIGLNTRLVGSKGIIYILANGKTLSYRLLNNTPYLQDEIFVKFELNRGATITAFEEMTEAIIDHNEVTNILSHEILLGMQILNGIMYSSIKNGRRISLDEIPETMIITGRIGELYA